VRDDVAPATVKHKLEHAGKTFYFCSAHCLEQFRKDPERFPCGPARGTAASSSMGAPTQIGSAPAEPTRAPAGRPMTLLRLSDVSGRAASGSRTLS